MNTISVDQVLVYYEKIIKMTGGTPGIRNKSMIDSALSRGVATFDGKYLYPTTVEKIAAITHSLITNHAFTDGNKRIGVAVMLLLLRLNDVVIEYTQNDLIKLGLETAAGKYDLEDITDWIIAHIMT
jgi:death-on-curing protein